MPVSRIPDIAYNPILDTDSYKLSHWKQYPPGTTRMMSYFESRGGEFAEATLFGLQPLLHKYLTTEITEAMVDQAETFAQKHGEPFNRDGWMKVVKVHGGKLPLCIRAIPEGLVVPTRNVLMTVESTDPDLFWIASWFETMLVRLWYPSTIAISSRESKKILVKYLELTSDQDPMAAVVFKLHDFGARGVCSLEEAQLGGSAHLLNFLGSDTISGIEFANHYYDCDMAGFSIPASEHSTVTMWGKENEKAMFKNYVETYLVGVEVPEGIPKMAACVSDTYNIFNAVRMWTTGEIKDLIKASGGTLVIRPDSGEPTEVLTEILHIMADTLADEIVVNSKGFRVLPDWVRVIQGDGITRKSMDNICKVCFLDRKWSVDDIAFGSGGGLLRMVNRDTQKWAFKCCAALVNGEWRDVRKDPITDSGKRSKAGRLDLIRNAQGAFETVVLGDEDIAHPDSVMQTVFLNGDILVHHTFAECRERMAL